MELSQAAAAGDLPEHGPVEGVRRAGDRADAPVEDPRLVDERDRPGGDRRRLSTLAERRLRHLHPPRRLLLHRSRVGPGRLLAELYGKRTGYCGGKGGRHIADTAHKLFGKSGTIGGHAPLAVGMATAAQIRGDDAVVMSFFGDGASNRGTTHESMNLSALWKLPVVWVCENNAWAGMTPVSLGHGGGRHRGHGGVVRDPGEIRRRQRRAGGVPGHGRGGGARPGGGGAVTDRAQDLPHPGVRRSRALSRPGFAIPRRSRPGSGGTRSTASAAELLGRGC